MKNVKNYLLAGLGAMMLWSCSDDVDSSKGDDGLSFSGEGEMTINLKFAGADARTRAEDKWDTRDGGHFEEGEDDESTIKDVTIYYFSADGNNIYWGKGSGTFTTSDVTGTGNNVEQQVNVEVPVLVINKLSNSDEGANIIAVLNKTEELSNLENSLIPDADTYADFNAKMQGADDAGFMMTSVNYFSNGKATYFNKITKKNVYQKGGDNTDKEVVDDIYVERVCGKVTLKKADQMKQPDNASVTIGQWGLNVRNTVFYPVKMLDDSFTKLTGDKWPGASIWTNTNAEGNHRSYWAKDPNYNDGDQYSSTPGEENYPFSLIPFSNIETSLNHTLYCLENTFDHTHQNRDETTTAVLYAQFIPNGEKTSTLLPTNWKENNWNTENKNTWVSSEGSPCSLAAFINQFFKNNNIYNNNSGADSPITASDIDFTYTAITNHEGKTIGGHNYEFTPKKTLYKQQGGTFNEVEGQTLSNLQEAFKKYFASASIYINGYCYYEIPIRHFYNSEVPWNEGNELANQEKHLGRYGIVRNHWYQLTINKINNPGKPIDKYEPTPDPDPDDKTSYYLDITIKVLSWAVRQQGVDL